MSNTQYELQVRNVLARHTTSLSALADSLGQAASAPGSRAPAQLKDIMKNVSDALQEAQHVFEEHANGSIRVSDDLLLVAAGTIGAANEVASAVALLEAVRPLRP